VSNAERYAYVILEWNTGSGPFDGISVMATPGHNKFTAFREATLAIYYENFSDATVSTDLFGVGLNLESTSDVWTATRETMTWQETFSPVCFGSVNNVNAVLTGKIKAKVKVTH